MEQTQSVYLVRSHLEYAVQAWNRNLQGNIDKIEKVQKRTFRIQNII